MLQYYIVISVLVFKQIFCEKCVCVPFWKCEDDYDDDSNVLGIRSGCEGYFDICCKINCGQKKTVHIGMIRDRILGNNEANFAEFPWMLGITHNSNYRCGGSLIHPQVALTAAHCVHSDGAYKVRAGEWNWRSRKEPLKHQDRQVKKVIIHPRYNPNSLVNDIALVIVSRAFQLTDNVGVVCLPQQNSSPFPEECVVTGWGKTSQKSTQYQTILNKAVFPIVHNLKCEEELQRAHLGPTFRLHPSFICAGGRNKDACKGDGGSPLVCGIQQEEDRYEQFGIVSWGLLCGLSDTPGVYVGVAQFMDWIDGQMTIHGFDTGVYKHEK